MRHPLIIPLALGVTASATSMSTTVPVNISTQNACIFDLADSDNENPTIQLNDYAAADASTYSGPQGEVTISVYCNKGTVPSARKLNGSATALSQSSAVTVALTNGADTFDALAWMVYTSSGTAITSGTFKGADRFSTTIQAGFPAAPQYSAPSGDYSGNVLFSVEF